MLQPRLNYSVFHKVVVDVHKHIIGPYKMVRAKTKTISTFLFENQKVQKKPAIFQMLFKEFTYDLALEGTKIKKDFLFSK